jgi:hypothetical protein
VKKILILIILANFILSYTSCITSLYPLVTAKNIIVEKQIEGQWMYKGMEVTIFRTPDSIVRMFTRVKDYPNRTNDSIVISQSYLVIFQKDSVEYNFQLALTRLDNNLFIHLFPAGFIPKIDSTTWQKKYGQMLAYVPTYTIAKLQIQNSHMLVIKFLNGKFIKEQVKAGKIMIKHEEDELFDMFLITASSEELQRFLSKYGNDERLYSRENNLVLQGKPQ